MTMRTPMRTPTWLCRVALRVICTAVILLPSVAAAAATSPAPDDGESPGSVMAMVSDSRPISVIGGGRREPPAAISPLPLLKFSDLRDVTRSPRRQTVTQTTSFRPKQIPIVRMDVSKNRKPNYKTQNKRNRNGKKKIVLKNKVIVRLESTPKTINSQPWSAPPSTSTMRVQEIVQRCTITYGRLSDVFVGTLKSFAFQLAVSVVFALLLVVVMAIYRCWTLRTRRPKPFHVFP